MVGASRSVRWISERSRPWLEPPIFFVRPAWRAFDHASCSVLPLDPTWLWKSDERLEAKQIGLLWPARGRKRLSVGIEQRDTAKAVLFGQFQQLILGAVCKTPPSAQVWPRGGDTNVPYPGKSLEPDDPRAPVLRAVSEANVEPLPASDHVLPGLSLNRNARWRPKNNHS